MSPLTSNRNSKQLLKKQWENLTRSVTRETIPDQYTQATDLTTHIPLPQETAIPDPNKTHNNGWTPLDLINHTNDRYGSRERAALATVFGVHEYTEPKIFWENDPEMNKSSHKSESVKESNAPTLSSSQSMPSGLFSKHHSSRHNKNSRQDATTEPKRLLLLPEIPSVSSFDDLLQFDTNSSLWQAHLPALQSNLAATRSHYSQPEGLSWAAAFPTHAKKSGKEDHELVVAPPLLFIDYPPAIFDLLASDDDERVIKWGPDPSIISASMATTAISSTKINRSVKGFSSNITPAAQPDLPSASRLPSPTLRWSAQLFSEKARELKEPTSFSIDPSQKTLSKRQSLVPKFKRNMSLPSEDRLSPLQEDIPKVIEAASVEKLVEKLTNSLDYTFMTDFFLIYRSFISPTQLCKLLILRFRWALETDDSARQVVRIRTFVVMRHWLLNYFVHDFIPCRNLREVLTSFLNTLPNHPIVKRSTRDQRIVKGLKRVVRRLKSVYYESASSQNVRVIPPPPPTLSQERAEELARSKLSFGTIRRMAALGVDVGGRHNGNVAVQDFSLTPIVVVGSIKDKSPAAMSPRVAERLRKTASLATSLRSFKPIKRSGHDSKNKSKTINEPVYQQQLETEGQSKSSLHNGQADAVPYASIISDASLESEISPGNTDIDTENGSDTKDAATVDDSRSWKSVELSSRRLLLERRRREEEEEERMRAAFYSGEIISTDQDTEEDEDGNVNGCPADSSHSVQGYEIAGVPYNIPSPQGSPTAASLASSRAAALAALTGAPRRGVKSGDTSSPLNHGVPFSQWRRRASGDDIYESHRDLAGSIAKGGTYVEETLHKMQRTSGLRRSLSLEGLTLALSKKSMERKHGLLHESAPTSLAPSPLLGPQSAGLSAVPDLDLLPEIWTKQRDSTGKLNDRIDGSTNDVYAISYNQTSPSSPSIPAKSSTQLSGGRRTFLSKKNLSGKLSRAFSRKSGLDSRPPMLSSQSLTQFQTNIPDQSIKCTTIPLATEKQRMDHSASRTTVGTNAKELSNDLGKECLCAQCTGNTESTQACRRVSTMSDEESRKNLELQGRRGANVNFEHLSRRSRNERETSSGEDKESSASSQLHYARSTSDEKSTNTHKFGTDQESIVSGSTQRKRPSLHSVASCPAPRVSRFVELSTVPSCLNLPPVTDDREYMTQNNRLILSFGTDELAQQFCFVERDVLLAIDWEEMVHCRWTRIGNNGLQVEKLQNNGGIEKVIERFNTVCQWVTSEIVSTSRMGERVKVVEKFIRLAKKCYMYSNFATLVQILLGLQSPSVTRLRKTWDRVHTNEHKMLQQLSHFTSPFRNWKHIRDSMTIVAEEHGMSPTQVQVEMPGTNIHAAKTTKIKYPFGGCIPFLGIYLSDLVFNSEQPAYLEPSLRRPLLDSVNISPVLKQPLVNFRKHRITATVIKRVLVFQGLARRYSFDLDEELYTLCRDLCPLDIDAIRALSLKLDG